MRHQSLRQFLVVLFAGASVFLLLVWVGYAIGEKPGREAEHSAFKMGRIILSEKDCRQLTFDNDTGKVVAGGLASCDVTLSTGNSSALGSIRRRLTGQ